mmetsp:Transcript_35440/g.60738  ORF Transcript_35440/g.60738 Transcript_35440/m.60738 type:complete len:204 (-) Transcript_35440:384-995(-)
MRHDVRRVGFRASDLCLALLAMTTCQRTVLLLLGLFVAEKALPNLLRYVSELIGVLASKGRDRLLGDVAELVVLPGLAREVSEELLGDVAKLVVLLAQVVDHPRAAPPLNLAGDVAELVVALARELGHLLRHARGDLARQVSCLVLVLAAVRGDGALDARVHLEREVARRVALLAGQPAHLLFRDLVERGAQVAQLVLVLATE